MNHKQSFVIRFVLLMLLLALPVLACSALSGGDEDGETAITAGEVGTATATENPEEAAGREENSVNESSAAVATVALDSDGAAAEATETAMPEATGREESTDEPGEGSDDDDSDGSPSGSADSDGDQGSSPADGAAVDGWGDSGSGPQSACDHPYLPLRTGATWTYDDGLNGMVWEVLEVVGDLNSATAVLRITVESTSIDYHWSCESGSGLASFDFANVTSAAVGIEMTLEQVEADGQFLLPADQLQPGATWETYLESPISFTQGMDDAQLIATGNMITVQKNQVLSTDPVTFDGLSVPGVQIEQTDDISLDLSILGNSVSQSLSITNRNHLGRGIGMVSQSSLSDFGATTTQLVSYSIP